MHYYFGGGNAMSQYTKKHARAEIDTPLPKIECFENQFKNYEITISIPEFTSICPRSGLPRLWNDYDPLYSQQVVRRIKISLNGYPRLPKFRHLLRKCVNRILKDFVKASQPIRAVVTGEFNVRGGMKSVIEASYPSPSKKS